MDIKDKAAELQLNGFCVLRSIFPSSLIDASREAFQPTLVAYLAANVTNPNRGPHRHFLPVPFQPFSLFSQFFFNPIVLEMVRLTLGATAVADQWGCDAPVLGSLYQDPHVDYQRPLFPEFPDLVLPIYLLVVSFGLIQIEIEHGPIEIAAGTHRMTRDEAKRAVSVGDLRMSPVLLGIGDVLIRHPWALHRGTPNLTKTPRTLLTIRYVRPWYNDDSREVCPIPRSIWQSLGTDQRRILRFPILD
jgi:hypothetical protein